MMAEEGRSVLIFSRKEGEENNLKKYAEFILLLDNLEERKEEIIREGEKLRIKYAQVNNCNNNKDLVKIIEENKVSYTSLDDLSTEYLNIVLYFEVYEESDHDLFIGEILCPFMLYRSRNKIECILTIASRDGNEDIRPFSYAISRYMYYESLCKQRCWTLDKINKFIWKDISDPIYANDYYNQCFTYAGGKAIRLYRKLSYDNMANVIPLIKLNTSSYYILSQSVEESFGSEEEFKRLWGEYNLLEELKNKLIKDQSYFDSQQEYRVGNLADYEKKLIEVLIQSICTYSLRTTWSKEDTATAKIIYYACKHVSLLACLFFTSFCRDLKSDKNIVEDKNKVIKLINLAQDYADGILQIIENAREYAEAGYMKIRIININKNSYSSFKSRYKDYFAENNTVKHYLQIQISDISQNDIVTSFVRNNQIGSSDISKGLHLKDFFVPLSENKGSQLKEYYENLENIAQHYGIRQFVSIINTEKGHFEVISTNKYKINQECRYSNTNDYKTGGLCLPGTEYKILFPIHYELREEQESVGFGAEADYKDISVKNNWKCKVFDYSQLILTNQYLQTVAESQMKKIAKINLLVEYIRKEQKKNQILCFDVANINQMWKIEILTKAIVLYIVKSNTCQRIALYNATRNFMINFTRYICNFYENISNCEVKKSVSDTQLYICKDDYSVDVGFKGKNLTDAYAVCDYLARTRGVFDDCLELINSTINRGKLEVNSNKPVKFAPFDLLVTVGNCSLFEERVKSDLRKNIQSTAFGCCLNDAHMRVGSKMHITDKFYDATLLFASGYYISRFAYLLAKKIADQFDVNSKITLVGYENYSELLLTEIQRLLEKTFIMNNVNYIIYEQKNKNGFKFVEQNIEYTEQQYIVIVPINSTLTTHSKIEAEIHKRISDKANIMMNLAVILIRSTNGENEEKALLVNRPRGIEKKYWADVDTKDRIVTTKITKPDKVFYNVLISSEWENPLTCKACFPINNPINERPMLTMSHTSVIPMILIGLKQRNISQYFKLPDEMEKKISELDANAGNIEMLHDSLIYGHIENGSNHFEYYFETERLMKRICERNYNVFSSWLNNLKKIIQMQNRQIKRDSSNERYIYDILVAPMNRTNASFVEYINAWAFESVPIIVYIDANREFRDNIKTKYSNLSALYNNLIISRKKAVINFHYIDDSIISGTTFYRTRSLLKSLFPANAFEEINDVYVNVFQNVILLLNRCSYSTKLNYAQPNHFFSYIDVHISSMRTHHDKACVLCENVNNYKMLRDYSSTNAMAEEWNRKLNKHSVKSIEVAREIYSHNKGMQERHYRRLYCANRFSDQLDLIKERRNDSKEVKKLIVSLITQKVVESEEIDVVQNNIEWILSYLKVIARPFPVFRKSTLEAVFSLLIEIMENWGRVSEDSNSIYTTIEASLKIVSEEKCTVEFLQCVEGLYRSIISLLSSLGAKYLVRKGSYDKLIKNDPLLLRANKERELKLPKLDVDFREEFELFYAANIKRMIILNKDETVGLWFEHLLVYGYENGQTDRQDEEFVQRYGIKSDFGRRLFLENTYIIFQTVSSLYEKCKKHFQEEEGGIEEKKEIIKEEISDFETAYYYENYRNLYNSENKLSVLQELKEEIQQMVLLYGHLEGYIENEKNVMKYYSILADLMHNVAKADEVLLLGCSTFEKKNDIYEIASSIKSKNTSIKIEFESIINNINSWESNQKILKDQEILIILEEKNCVAIRIDSNREKKSDREQDVSDVIYCVFYFNALKEMDDYALLCRIRNILVFRHTFVQRFRNDFYNNAFKVLTDQRHQNELLISRKAVTHTSNSTLYYVVEEMKKEKNSDLVYAAYALQLAADSLISQLYVDMIKKTENESLCSSFLELKISDRMENTFNQLRFYSDSDQITKDKYTGLIIENEATEVLKWNIESDEQHYIQLIMVAILHNAAKHGLADNNRKVHVKIYQEIKDDITYLCFENETRFPCVNDYNSEESQGITVLALKHYFKKNFGREVIDQIFTRHEKVMFVIKLPIYKEIKYDEKDKGASNRE